MQKITAQRIKELLDYDPQTGVFTRKKREDLRPCWNSRHAGKIAGYPHLLGYLTICVDGTQNLAHRLAWLYFYGEWPKNEIDHINGIKTDNRIANLREATSSQNKFNTQKKSHNMSGFKGVYWSKSNKKWTADIRKNKELVYRRFFDTPEEASYFRNYAAEYYHGEFARSA